MLASRLDVLRQLHVQAERDESRHIPLVIGSVHGVVELVVAIIVPVPKKEPNKWRDMA